VGIEDKSEARKNLFERSSSYFNRRRDPALHPRAESDLQMGWTKAIAAQNEDSPRWAIISLLFLREKLAIYFDATLQTNTVASCSIQPACVRIHICEVSPARRAGLFVVLSFIRHPKAMISWVSGARAAHT
jgi:hypothetical protein